MNRDFQWRKAALLGLFAGGVGMAFDFKPRLEVSQQAIWRHCEVALALDGAIVCEGDLEAALPGCAGGAQTPMTLSSGDALVCDAQNGWQRTGRVPPLAAHALQVPVDLNRASADEMMTLPFVGAKRAEQWMEHRPLATWEHVDALPGVGPKLLQALQERGVLAGADVPCIGIDGAAMWCARCRL